MSTEQTITGQEKLDQTLDVMDGLFRDRLTEIGQRLKRGEARPDAKGRLRLSESLAENLLLPAVLNPNRVTQTDKAKLAVAILDVINTIDTEVELDDKGEPREPTPAGRLETIISTAKDELRNLVIEINKRELPQAKIDQGLTELTNIIAEIKAAQIQVRRVELLNLPPDDPQVIAAGDRASAARNQAIDFAERLEQFVPAGASVTSFDRQEVKNAIFRFDSQARGTISVDEKGTLTIRPALQEEEERLRKTIQDKLNEISKRAVPEERVEELPPLPIPEIPRLEPADAARQLRQFIFTVQLTDRQVTLAIRAKDFPRAQQELRGFDREVRALAAFVETNADPLSKVNQLESARQEVKVSQLTLRASQERIEKLRQETQPEPVVPFVPDREKDIQKFRETLRKIGEEFIEGTISQEERDERTNEALDAFAPFLEGEFISKQGLSRDDIILRMTGGRTPLRFIKDPVIRNRELNRRTAEVTKLFDDGEIDSFEWTERVIEFQIEARGAERPPEPPLIEQIEPALKDLEQAKNRGDALIVAALTNFLQDRLRELRKEQDRLDARIRRLESPGSFPDRNSFLAAAQNDADFIFGLIKKIQRVAPIPEAVIPEPSETDKIQRRLREHGFQLEKFTQDPSDENTKALQDSRDNLDEALKSAGLTAIDINTELLLEPPSPTVGDVMRDASTFLDRLIFPYERKFGPLFVPKAPDVTLLWDRAVESAKTAREAFLKGDLNAMNSAFADMLPRLALFRNRVQKDADVLGNAGPFLQKHSSTVLELADKHGDGLASALAGRIGQLPSGPGALGKLIERNTLAACLLGAFYGALEAVREAAGRIRIEDVPGDGKPVIGIEFPELGGTPPSINAEKTAEQATIFQASLRDVDARLKEPVPAPIEPPEEVEEPISRPARPELEREFRLPRRPPLAPAPPRSIPPP